MELVELIRGIATDERRSTRPSNTWAKLGKTIAVAEDSPPHRQRILLPMITRRSTRSMKASQCRSDRHAMRLARTTDGPLELADFIGLDTCLSVMQVCTRLGRLQVPPVSAVGEICRGRLLVVRRSAASTTIAAKSPVRRGDNSFCASVRRAMCGEHRTSESRAVISAWDRTRSPPRRKARQRAYRHCRRGTPVAAHLGQILLGGVLRMYEFDAENAAAGLWLAQRAALQS